MLTCLLSAAAPAADWPRVEPQVVRAHVEFLADDRLEGRAPGTRGYDLAALYVVAQMRSMGLAPAGPRGEWLQPLTVVESSPVPDAARATLEFGAKRVELQVGSDFAPSPSIHGPTAAVNGPLVYAGHGVSAPEVGHDDLRGLDLSGAVVVIRPGLPRSIPPQWRDYYRKEKFQQLAAAGAAGVVVLTTPCDEAREPWAEVRRRTERSIVRALDAGQRPIDSPRGIDASITLGPGASERLLAASRHSIDELCADRAAGEPGRIELHARISFETRSALQSTVSHNVIGLLQGSDTRLRDEYVVFLAHLDHFGRRAAVDGDDIYNGALDNAGGVAVLLETARALAGGGSRPHRSILFLAVTAEERGLNGSRYFALHPTVPAASIVAAINIDMPVALYPAAGYTAIGAGYSTLGESAHRALAAEGLRVLPEQAPERGLFTYTDQYSFVREGIPALYLHDGPLSSDPAIDAQHLFDDYLARHYHRPSDSVALPIDWQALARFAQVHARLGRDIADSPERPAWRPCDPCSGPLRRLAGPAVPR